MFSKLKIEINYKQSTFYTARFDGKIGKNRREVMSKGRYLGADCNPIYI